MIRSGNISHIISKPFVGRPQKRDHGFCNRRQLYYAWVFLRLFLTFLGDQFFHIWSKSVVLDLYNVPDSFNSFGRGLTPRCITIRIFTNQGYPCTSQDSALSHQEYTERENDVSNIQTNTSHVNQVQFLKAASLPRGDLAVLYPAVGVVSSSIDYRARTLGVSTQCQLMTPICRIKHLSD